MWIAAAYQPYCGSYRKLCVFLTLCQFCSYGCTMGTVDTIIFEILNFNSWNLFWLGLDGIEARMLDLYRFMQWSWKESKWSWKNHICPYFDHVACNFNKKRSNGLGRKSRSSPFCRVSAISEQKWLFCAGEWPNWLPMVGHTLAKTHVYKSKYTSPRTYWLTVIHPLCVHSPLPDPWLSWALTWTSCMHEDPI